MKSAGDVFYVGKTPVMVLKVTLGTPVKHEAFGGREDINNLYFYHLYIRLMLILQGFLVYIC